MAVLEKIRVKLGILISILIAIALLSFIIDPNTLGSTLQSMSKDNNVGEMNGKAISYRDYYTALEQNTQLMNALNGGNANSEEAQNQLREMTWNQLFNQKIFFPKVKKAGFSVEDAEMVNLLQGETASPVIAQQRMFVDENGQFSSDAVKEFISQMDLDESGVSRKYWEYLKEQVYAQQMYGKYYSALRNSATLNASQIDRAIAEGNTTKDIDFFVVPISFGVDSTIQISSAEVAKFYNDRKDLFVQPANRDIEYVMFEVVPSQEDIDATREEFDGLYEQFAQADNLKNFVALNSDRRWEDKFYSKEELPDVFADYAFGGSGSISPVEETAEAFTAVRVAERKMMPDRVNFSFKVFPAADKAVADSLLTAVRKNGTSDELSKGGWVTMDNLEANNMGFFGEAFSMKKGEAKIIDIDAYQMVAVIKVDDADAPKEKVQLAYLRKNINPSDNTFRDFNMKAADLADRSSGKYEKFAEIVKEENLPVIPQPHVTIDTRRIGAVENARSVVHWVFDRKTKEGSVSDVITVDNKYYFVAAVTKARKEGKMALEDVKDNITMELINRKKVDNLAEEASAKVSGSESLEVLAEKFNTVVSHRDGISFAGSDMSLEPSLIGAVAAAEPGKVEGPVKGTVGVYFFEVKDATTGEYYTEADAVNKAAQVAASQLRSLTDIVAQEADVKDYRGKFY
ncbi:MAG: SurA N-terminal domain-containing protein [Bacteroidales bacterium]|nr:SurA N-terminal domain-containing protein [Bacteroidales bacterium]